MQPVWTRKDIERWLVAAYRLDPRETSAGAREAASWPALYVLEWPERRAIHLWAWSKAGGHQISDICRDHGLSRSTFENRRARALGQIEAGLNAERARKCA